MLFKSLNPFVAVILYTLILTSFLLYPFDFSYPPVFMVEVKDVSKISDEQTSSISGFQSILPAKKLFNELVAGNGITIEVWVTTKDITQKGPARIISYSLNNHFRNFTLGQEAQDLIMRLRTTQTNLNGRNPQATLKNVFRTGELQHITVTYNYSMENIYVNGKRMLEVYGPGGRFSNWDDSYYLILGNELSGNRLWHGKLYLAAIYNRALSEHEVLQNYKAGSFVSSAGDVPDSRIKKGLTLLYSLNGENRNLVLDHSGLEPLLNLHKVEWLYVTEERPYLRYESLCPNLSLESLKDIIINIVIFIPLGFLLHGIIRGWYGSSMKIVLFAFILGTLISFSIESLQYLTLTRFSSREDLSFNMIGTAIGIIVDKYTYFCIYMKRTSSC